MLAPSSKRPGDLESVERIAAWTRERFRLGEDDAVLVSEIACKLAGCPPLETVVAFWTGAGTRHHFKVFKRLDAVVRDDLPYAWLIDSLVDVQGFACECC